MSTSKLKDQQMAAANTTAPQQTGANHQAPAQPQQTLDMPQQMQGATPPQQMQGAPSAPLYTDFASI